MKDPGLFTDGTGDGMAGATDIQFDTQQALKETVYNGTHQCKGCGAGIDPVQSLRDMQYCPTCNRRKQANLVKGRMA